MTLAAVVGVGGAGGEALVAWVAAGFEARGYGGEAGSQVILGEGEEGGLGAVLGGFDGLRDLVKSLPDARVGAAHGL